MSKIDKVERGTLELSVARTDQPFIEAMCIRSRERDKES